MNWEQLKTILWLRWRLTVNQWKRSGGLGAVLAAIVGIGAATASVIGFIVGLIVGITAMRDASPAAIMGVWAGFTGVFLFSWMIGLLAELQRSETIDLQRLMHLPVLLGQMFVVNFVASHFVFSVIVFVPAMIGLSVGLVFSHGALMLFLTPLVLTTVFMVSAWTYCLRGWLAAMMSNPRRRRTVITFITLAFILVAQAPNLYFNVLRRNKPTPSYTVKNAEELRQRRELQNAEKRRTLDNVMTVQKCIPPFWLPVGARALAEGSAWPAVLGVCGGALLGLAGLRRAYISTRKFFQGEIGAKAAVVQPDANAPKPKPSSMRFLELQLRGIPEQSAAIAVASFRSMLRAPEVKMAWATSFIVVVVIGVSVFQRSVTNIPVAVKPFLATGAGTFTVFMMFGFLANQFGFDRDGFRALVLCPADRRLILLGRNLATVPVGALFGLLVIGLISIGLKLPLLTTLAAFLQLATTLMLAGLAGNLLSILVPYRIQPGTMKPTKMPALAMLMMVACQLLSPLVMSPVFFPPLLEFLWRKAGWPEVVPVNFLFSAILVTLAVFGYWLALGPLGRLLQKRETKILNIVTAEVE